MAAKTATDLVLAISTAILTQEVAKIAIAAINIVATAVIHKLATTATTATTEDILIRL